MGDGERGREGKGKIDGEGYDRGKEEEKEEMRRKKRIGKRK